MNEGLYDQTRVVERLITEVRSQSVALATFSTELRGVREHVISLLKIVKEGDQQESLITKVALIEQSLEEIEGVVLRALIDDLNKLKIAISTVTDSKALMIEESKGKREIRAEKLKLWGLIVAGVVTLASSAIAILK